MSNSTITYARDGEVYVDMNIEGRSIRVNFDKSGTPTDIFQGAQYDQTDRVHIKLLGESQITGAARYYVNTSVSPSFFPVYGDEKFTFSDNFPEDFKSFLLRHHREKLFLIGEIPITEDLNKSANQYINAAKNLLVGREIRPQEAGDAVMFYVHLDSSGNLIKKEDISSAQINPSNASIVNFGANLGTIDNPKITLLNPEERKFKLEWSGSTRVPRSVGGLSVQYMRDGILQFLDNSYGSYDRIIDAVDGKNEIEVKDISDSLFQKFLDHAQGQKEFVERGGRQ